MKMFPIIIDFGGGDRKKPAPHPQSIPWSVAELAYSIYARDHGGRGQSLETVAERGGFYGGEMDILLPDWRERSSEVTRLKSELDAALKALRACNQVWKFFVEFETFKGVGEYLDPAMDLTEQVLNASEGQGSANR